MYWIRTLIARLRFVPLCLAIAAADAWARWRPGRWPRPVKRSWRPGISVLIPERGTPDLLAQTLQAAHLALQQVTEPTELLVLVNGAPAADYAELRARYPAVRWQFHAQALGYNGAIAKGLALLRHDWVYLLNSDMVLEPDALQQLLPYRQPEVFAITSQIHFVDRARRREETGWSDCRIEANSVQMYERESDGSPLSRGNLYPGGGSSLCRAAVLRRYVRDSACYSPFYYEDAQWGARAWAEGWEVLFCPLSHAHHHHRGTVGRHYQSEEVERVVQRNARLFELRQGWTSMSAREAVAACRRQDDRTQRELRPVAQAWGVLRQRLAARRALARGLEPQRIATDHIYPPPRSTHNKPRVLIVTPFAAFPPAHGGARRMAELTRRLADQVDLILLSDERSLYDRRSEEGLGSFRAIHLTEGRADVPGESPLSWSQRMERHAHPRLRAELDRLIAVYRPHVVQVEFMELAALRSGAARTAGAPRWLLALHDVVLGADGGADDAVQRRLLSGFDALTVCSAEDAALLEHGAVHLLANGAQDRRSSNPSSPDECNILFMGPFRYAPNLAGIRRFVEQAWPAIRSAHPRATLSILGGAESRACAAEPWLQAAGVELIDHFVDPTPWLARASLSINPQLDVRGSALKVIESLLAARVCVSTSDGARGYAQANLPGLVIVPDVPDMAAAVNALLADSARRRHLERGANAALDAWTWDGIAAEHLALYRRLSGVPA